MNDTTPKTNTERPESVARRNILRGAMVAVPVVATLSSGAALARSSSIIGSASAAAARDASGDTLCLDETSGYRVGSGLDLGTPPSGTVNVITQRDYRVEPRGSASAISEAQMCTSGGEYYYQSAGWRTIDVPKGILVSATALSSFAGAIRYREI